MTSPYVFTYCKRHIGRVDKAFKAALSRAGIEDFTFHDLRHTFASHLVMRGASLKEVQELLGHKSISMTMRYAHLSQDSKKKAVNLLNGLTGGVNSDMSQNVTFDQPRKVSNGQPTNFTQ
ncbi:MAG: tyrosine-type recombinase/integrase [Desulfatiglandales bacterium]